MNLDQAKELFISMGCSSFHMCREYSGGKYEQYKKLNISKEQENSWRLESIKRMHSKIQITNNYENIWCTIDSMATEARDIESYKFIADAITSLRIILESIRSIKANLPPFDKIMISETIIGRQKYKSREGLLFLAIDLKQKKITTELSEIALSLLTEGEANPSADKERCSKALKRLEHMCCILKIA